VSAVRDETYIQPEKTQQAEEDEDRWVRGQGGRKGLEKREAGKGVPRE